jgi:hypothetical protein
VADNQLALPASKPPRIPASLLIYFELSAFSFARSVKFFVKDSVAYLTGELFCHAPRTISNEL